MNKQNYSKYYLNPIFLFLMTLLSVFFSEVLVMFLLSFFPGISLALEALLDAFLLSIIVVPFLYVFMVRPLIKNISIRREVEIEKNKIIEVDKIKSEFISIAAHELRTPLSAIMGYSEILLDEEKYDVSFRKEFISIINQKSEVMERLIDDLLDLSRLEMRRPIPLKKEKNEIVSTIKTIVNEFKKKYPERRFEVNLPPPEIFFYFDKLRLEQVVGNLLSNAVKFSPKDRPVQIEGEKRNNDFLVRVCDKGIGMSSEELLRVFEKFYRADTSNTSASGLGLGMTIVKEIIALHGGEIWLDSVPGAGTTVNFLLPIHE